MDPRSGGSSCPEIIECGEEEEEAAGNWQIGKETDRPTVRLDVHSLCCLVGAGGLEGGRDLLIWTVTQ